MNAIGCTAREAQEAQALTCGMVSMIDDAVGRVQAALADSGRGERTVTIFTSDHGDHLGDHRLLFKGSEQYEQITRVPFVWADPQGEQGTRSDRLGQTLDIGATILERARIEQAWGMQGRDLLSEASAPKAVLIQYAHQARMDGLDVCPNIRTVRDARYRPLGRARGRAGQAAAARTADAGRTGPCRNRPGARRPRLIRCPAQASRRALCGCGRPP